MIQFSTIQNPYVSLERDDTIPFNWKAIDSIELQCTTNAPHQLNITFNQNDPELYNLFADNPYSGIRIDQSDGLSLTFIKKPNYVKDEETVSGKLLVRFVSTITLLHNTRVYPRKLLIGKIYSGTDKDYFLQTTDKINVDFYSDEELVEFMPSIGDTYDLLMDGVSRLNRFTILDRGVRRISGTEKINIEVGRIEDKEADPVLFAGNMFESAYAADGFILINDAKKVASGEELTHLRVFMNQGQGGDLSSTQFLDSTNIESISIKPDFPLVPSTEQLANGRVLYDIKNTRSTVDIEVSEVYPINIEAEIQDGNAAQNINQAQYGYNRGVNFLRQKQENVRLDLDMVMPKIVLPTTRFQIQYRKEQENGVFAIDDIYTLGDITYSMTDFERFIKL